MSIKVLTTHEHEVHDEVQVVRVGVVHIHIRSEIRCAGRGGGRAVQCRLPSAHESRMLTWKAVCSLGAQKKLAPHATRLPAEIKCRGGARSMSEIKYISPSTEGGTLPRVRDLQLRKTPSALTETEHTHLRLYLNLKYVEEVCTDDLQY